METDRRALLKGSAGVVAASLLTARTTAAFEAPAGLGPCEAKAYIQAKA